MMKISLIITIMCLFSGLMGYGQGMMKPPKWKETELRGEVKSIKIQLASY